MALHQIPCLFSGLPLVEAVSIFNVRSDVAEIRRCRWQIRCPCSADPAASLGCQDESAARTTDKVCKPSILPSRVVRYRISSFNPASHVKALCCVDVQTSSCLRSSAPAASCSHNPESWSLELSNLEPLSPPPCPPSEFVSVVTRELNSVKACHGVRWES